MTEWDMEKEMTDLHTLNPKVSPFLIVKAKEGSRLTFFDCCLWVKEKPKQVYDYFGMARPKFDLVMFLLRCTGLIFIYNAFYKRRGLKAYHRPEVQNRIKGLTPAKRKPLWTKNR